MPAPVISVSQLGKRYKMGAGAATTLREVIGTMLTRGGASGQAFWPLRDVSFDVDRGEIVGIVGNNGAGKSTLLKILSRITPPTEGCARISGRIGSLLEVGTGFHPELSGRDNLFMNGLLLGMTPAEIRAEFDRIVDFSGVGDFIDVPVKRYSSGMYLRLAFAVAAHLRSEILLIDEVLAVGDVAFQKKCLARMDEVAHQGRTILFVSHNLMAVQALCPRTILIDRGHLVADGDTRRVLSAYLRSTAEPGSETERAWPAGQGPSWQGFELRGARAEARPGEAPGSIDIKTGLSLALEFGLTEAVSGVSLSLQLINDEGILVFDTGPPGGPLDWAAGRHRLSARIPGDLLNDGGYRVKLQLYHSGALVLDIPDLLTFEVLDAGHDRHGWYGKWHGVIRPSFEWRHDLKP